jgi:hypothetical protein
LTIKCQLITQECDIGGYITYVFKNLDKAPFGHNYIMVTRWPNWNHRDLELGEIGYLNYREVVAGVDTWYDGTNFIPYNYTNIIFIKFVKEQDNSKKDIIL